jgi:hypothetical protein
MSDPALPALQGAEEPISLPYLAGFFDGEGSIGIYPNGNGRGLDKSYSSKARG